MSTELREAAEFVLANVGWAVSYPHLEKLIVSAADVARAYLAANADNAAIAEQIAKLPTSQDADAARLRLMDEAVDRYLELCREGGVCDCGEHDDGCPFSQRPCVRETGGLCHWCQMDAARSGIDYRTIDAAVDAAMQGGTT